MRLFFCSGRSSQSDAVWTVVELPNGWMDERRDGGQRLRCSVHPSADPRWIKRSGWKRGHAGVEPQPRFGGAFRILVPHSALRTRGRYASGTLLLCLPALVPHPAASRQANQAQIDAPRSAPGNARSPSSKSGNAARRSSDAAASVDPRFRHRSPLTEPTRSDSIADYSDSSSGCSSTSGSSAHSASCTALPAFPLGIITDLSRAMAFGSDARHVDILEWSQELDRFLLQLPFRPLRTTQSVVLYKLAYSTTHSQLGLLLVDCDTCSAYYEGVSLRTLERRSHLDSSPSSSTDTEHARLARLAAAIHDALDATTSGSQASVDLETTRFSCSLATQTNVANASSARQLKTSFDLDPLNHAAHTALLSAHLVRPLLSLAAAIARAPTQDQLASIASEHNRAVQSMTSARSLQLIQATALSHAGHSPQLLQFTNHPPTYADEHDRVVQDVGPPSSSSNPAKSESALHGSLDGHRDMVFFGPPGFKPPRSSHNDDIHDSSHANGHGRDLAISSDAESNDEDGDVTLSATDIVRLTAAQQPERQPSLSPSNAVAAAASILRIKTEPANEASDSDTSQEEESLPVKRPLIPRASPAPPSISDQAQSTVPVALESGDIDVNARDTRTKEDQEVLPPATPSASAFAPTPSQIVSPARNAARNEQLRRRQQIANIKRGHEESVSPTSTLAASGHSARSDTTRLGAKQPQTSRKRSRF